MIWTILSINVRRLLHNRMELLLTFVVPIVFFSIFAIIFGHGTGAGTTPKIKVGAVDEVESANSRAVIASLHENPGLRFMRGRDTASIDRREAREMVRRGSLTMAIVLRAEGDRLAVDLLSDASDQVAAQVVTALVARSMMMVEAKQLASRTSRPVSHIDQTQNSFYVRRDTVNQTAAPTAGAASPWPDAEMIRSIDVIGEGKSNPKISMYAAGIAVMFLLFGATGGGGVFLEERENQTLDRLLSTRLTMDQLLLGKWFYLTGLGVLQVSVMFLWAQFAFGIDLQGHLDGFLVMTVATALAASALGLCLATFCKTRGQLNGLSVVLVLSMSALGGSMVPRYVMSEQLQRYGLVTFNAWALDGYDKVFWRELPISALAPQLSVLLASSFAFLMLARVLALRWETD
jgi:ABC-2 type transport system permease protein